MIFDAGPARVACDDAGLVTSVVHRQDAWQSYVRDLVVGPVDVDGELLPVPLAQVLADLDEVEVTWTWPGRLQAVLRHTFAAGWGVRLAFTGLAGGDQQVDAATLRLRPDPGCVAWALTLGATAAYAVVPAAGTGPLLGGVLRRGAVAAADETGLRLAPFLLRAGARYVVQLDFDFYDVPRSFGHRRHPHAPSALFSFAGEAVRVLVDADVAVVGPAGLEVTRTEDALVAVADHPGIHPVELRSARGTTCFDLRWVDPLPETLVRWAGAVTGPRTASGVVRLAGVADALLVQHALARAALDDPDDAAEALDLYTARLGPAPGLSPLQVVYLCREHDRSGEPDLLDHATAALRAAVRPTPGVGLAGTQLCLRLLGAGRPVDEVLGTLLALVDTATAAGWSAADPVADQAASVELLAVTRAGPGASGRGGAADLTERVASLGLRLGAGLPGRAVSPLDAAVAAHLATVLTLLPDAVSGGFEPRWGCSASALAHRALPELLTRLDRSPVGEAHAWLLLGLQDG